ncbi:MAG TPA: sugar ABC transporter ATP-binding protein [Tepidisphaeraceae bacterium]|nr:sugar ABC transporter ATP-binding protein [Tepidisphaeraceae bacterium]
MTDPNDPTPPLLSARGITKAFPGVRALDGVDFDLRAGEIHALMGENGAGKSTLIKVLTGVYRRDAGQVTLDGSNINPRSPQHAQQLGISTVYQEVNLVPALSVAENIYLGRQPSLLGKIRWRKMYALAEAALARLDQYIDVTRPLDSYSIAIQQMVSIARALDVQARVLILDEPTSSLDAHEVQQLFAVIRRLAGTGLGIVFVTHFMDQVYELSHQITVLRNGKLVGSYPTQKLPRLELIARMMGRDLAQVEAMQHEHAAPPQRLESRPLLEASGVGKRGSVKPFDLSVRKGEVVGLAGLLGSGRTEMLRLLFGIDRRDSGTISIDGQPAPLRKPRQAIDRGLGFCPEDRKVAGIVPDLSIRENIILVMQAKRGWLRKIPRRKQEQLADQYIRALNIATPDAEKSIRLLSGGNQQKAILARWLAARPGLLILDEPTRGIDVGAKFEIARLMDSLCKEGMAILFVSSELEEVVRSCHRVAVLRDRQKVGELSGGEISEHRIMDVIAAAPEATGAADGAPAGAATGAPAGAGRGDGGASAGGAA